MVTETTTVDDSTFGGNASAEGVEDEGADNSTSQSGCNIVLANRLVEVNFDKKGYQVYIKDYMKAYVALLANDMHKKLIERTNIIKWKPTGWSRVAIQDLTYGDKMLEEWSPWWNPRTWFPCYLSLFLYILQSSQQVFLKNKSVFFVLFFIVVFFCYGKVF